MDGRIRGKVDAGALLGVSVALFMAIARPCPAHEPPPRFQRIELGPSARVVSVFDLHQDRYGFLWLATEDGLLLWDGYTVEVFRDEPGDPGSLADNDVRSIHEDEDGVLWIGTYGGGVDAYDRAAGVFRHHRHDPGDPESLSHDYVRTLHQDRSGVLWVGTHDGGLNALDRASGKVVRYQNEPRDPHSLADDDVRAIHEDRQGRLWVGTHGGGLSRLDRRTGTFEHHQPDPDDPTSLSQEGVRVIFEDRSGTLWIGTHKGGLERFDPETGTFEHFRHDPDEPASLGSDRVRAILEDENGLLWIGTYGGGLDAFDRSTSTFGHHRRRANDPFTLADEVLALLEDRSGLLFIGTERGLYKYDRRFDSFAHFRHVPGDPLSLRHADVRAVRQDRAGGLWVGTDAGLDRFVPVEAADGLWNRDPSVNAGPEHRVRSIIEAQDGALWVGCYGTGVWVLPAGASVFENYRQDAAGLSNDFVNVLYESRDGTMWIGSQHGVDEREPEGGGFRHYRFAADADGLSHDSVQVILEDSDGVLWFGTRDGLDRFDRGDRTFQNFHHRHDDTESLSHGSVRALYEDRQGTLWVGTARGLNAMDRERGTFRRYRKGPELPNETINGILEDADGSLWLATNGGLSRLDPERGVLRSYDARDGLQHDVFHLGAHAAGPGGRLFFGGAGGLTAFDPRRLIDHDQVPPVVLRSLRRLDELAAPAVDLTGLEHLELSHDNDLISLDFAALDYRAPEKNRYAYRLVGLHEDWVDLGHRREITFTDLDPGRYRLEVRGSNQDGLWNTQGATLRLEVRPPVWQTTWAYAVYSLAFAGLAVGFVMIQRRKVERERAISRQLRHVDKLREELLSNTSHELRTPLYGITGLAESLIEGTAGELPAAAKSDLSMIVSSGRRLGSLVDDILDVSKLGAGGLRLERRAVDLRPLADVVLTLSRPLIGAKDLRLRNEVPADLPAADADEARIEQVLHNLVGNALKFTDQGEVTLRARELHGSGQPGRLEVSVSDTGIGIAPEHQQEIFEAFAQAGLDSGRGGTGLGLSVSSRLIELHGGRLQVESALGAGSTFTFTLPLATAATPATAARDTAVLPRDEAATFEAAAPVTPEPSPASAPPDAARLLVVDDEPVNRRVLESHLVGDGHRVTTASSGAEALKLLDRQAFDLVLLDVMMPKMSGFEMCRELRRRFARHEMPVLFLTAKSQVGDRISGLEEGGNDYLVKPVTRGELQARVRTHLELLTAHRELDRLLEQRTDEVQILGGMLPICANCKKIRDDEGYWSQLEVFLGLRADLQFSHGLCPTCSDEALAELEHESFVGGRGLRA